LQRKELKRVMNMNRQRNLLVHLHLLLRQNYYDDVFDGKQGVVVNRVPGDDGGDYYLRNQIYDPFYSDGLRTGRSLLKPCRRWRSKRSVEETPQEEWDLLLFLQEILSIKKY